MPTPTAQFQPAVRPLLLNVNDAAAALSISRSLLYELLSAGQIRSIKIGRRGLIDVQSMREWHKQLASNQGLKATEEGAA